MRIASRLLSAAALLAVLAAAGSAAPILDPAKITAKSWDNGFRLIVKAEQQWGLASAHLVIRAGSAVEPADHAGVAHLLEHLLFEATDLRDEQRVGPAIEALGGYVNAVTTRDFTSINVTVASQYLDEALGLISRAVFEPQISEVTVAREREVIARELVDRADTAGGALDDLLWRTAFETHPYGRPIGGTAEQASALTAPDLLAFYARCYVPGNMALVVVGDVDPAAVQARVEELFGGHAAGTVDLPELPREPAQTDVAIAADSRPSQATIVSFAWHAPEVEEFDEVCAMDLIYTVLGEGRLGRLQGALVEPGTAVAVDVNYLTQRDPGLLVITALTPPDKETDARTAILAEIGRLRDEPLSAEALEQAKRVLRIGYAFSNEAYADQAGSLAFYEGIGGYQLAVEYIDRVNAITAEQLQAVARKYLNPDAYTLAIIRPAPRPGTAEEARNPCASPFVQG